MLLGTDRCFGLLVYDSYSSYLSNVTNVNVPHLHLVRTLGVTTFEFCGDFRHQNAKSLWAIMCGIVCLILHLAVSVEHRLVTDGQTHDDS